MHKPLFNYKWYLKDNYISENIEKHKLKVYTTFSCGGGSTMGYKLAGYEVIGANDIDPQMAKVYKENHNPKYYDLCPIGDLLNKDLPEEYYNLDILDGSPPCSTFSMAGSREKAFKKDKVFREGQAKQVLSDLFFDWIKLVEKLQPKVAIAENVKGMLAGNAKAYTTTVIKELNKIGYDVQLFCLNGASMGLPQKRERVFFICKRKDLNMKNLVLDFNEAPISFFNIDEKNKVIRKPITGNYDLKLWETATITNYGRGQVIKPSTGKIGTVGFIWKAYPNLIPPTAIASGRFYHYSKPAHLTTNEICQIGSYPLDYNFLDIDPMYLIGMSVPPVMTAQIAYQVYLQLFKK